MAPRADLDISSLRERLCAVGQAHLLDGWLSLSLQEQRSLKAQLESVDLASATRAFHASLPSSSSSSSSPPPSPDPLEPVSDVVRLTSVSSELRAAWFAAGLEFIASGRLAVLLLAGGQGTRLGSSAPKGCYDIGLPSGKSLFQLHAERILRVERLARGEAGAGEARNGARGGAGGVAATPPEPLIRWYVMTSQATDAETRAHFSAKSHFGLDPSQVVFFSQGELPAFSPDGRVLRTTPSQLALSPDGNGGVYAALDRCGVLDDLTARGVEALDVFCVDNALALPASPAWVGACLARQADCASRVVARAGAEEKVGVFALRGAEKRLGVAEYSEIDPARARALAPLEPHQNEEDCRRELLFNWANVCMHYFAVPWLRRVCSALREGSPPGSPAAQTGAAREPAPRAPQGSCRIPYHVARKPIPTEAGPVPGFKLERFIFDAFALARRPLLVEVERCAEFAPVKNAPGSASDCPDTARAAVLALHARWVAQHGGSAGAGGVEVSPLVSYAGEGLGRLVQGRQFGQPFDPSLQRDAATALALSSRTASTRAAPLQEAGARDKPGAGGVRVVAAPRRSSQAIAA